VLELKEVSRVQGGVPVLDRASLVISREMPTAIVGLTAYERSVLARVLSGQDKPQAGSIRLGGKDIAQVRRQKGRISVVGGDTQKRSKPGKGPGREQQMRAAFSKARSDRAALIILDAPATDLGLEARENFVGDLKALCESAGAIVVLLAGDADEAMALGGQVVVLERGEIVQVGPAADVFTHPTNLTAAIATSFPKLNTIAMTAREGRGVLADGSSFQPPEQLKLPDAGACTVAFHPDDMTLQRAGAGCLRFIVRAAGDEIVGGRRFVRVTFAGSDWLTPQSELQPHAGAILNAFVERSRLMAFDASGKAIG
jgi:ABC-type sugar transport system ATPase subunit